MPFIVSSKGYGVLWHNYSLSRFGDKRPYADLGDVFGLYGKDGRAGALTATYYTDKAKNSVLIQRDEDKVDYENLKTIKNLPADFPKPSASATWEGVGARHGTRMITRLRPIWKRANVIRSVSNGCRMEMYLISA